MKKTTNRYHFYVILEDETGKISYHLATSLKGLPKGRLLGALLPSDYLSRAHEYQRYFKALVDKEGSKQ